MARIISTCVLGTIETKKLSNSNNGNPRYEVTLKANDGRIIMGTTKRDSMFTFEMPTTGMANVKFHRSASSAVIFDDIEEF